MLGEKFSKSKHTIHCCKILLQTQGKRQLFSEIKFEIGEIEEEYICGAQFYFWDKNNN